MSTGDHELIPQRIEVTEEQFDAIMALLNEPPKPDPKLVELFARPSVFDSQDIGSPWCPKCDSSWS